MRTPFIRASRVLALVSVAIFGGGCGATPRASQVLVRIHADPGVLASATSLHISIFGGQRATSVPNVVSEERDIAVTGDGSQFPITLALAPLQRDASRVFRVVVSARDAANLEITAARIISGYVADRVLVADLQLRDACLHVACGDSQTCRTGTCETATVDPTTLPTLNEVSVTDAGADGGAVDAGDLDSSIADAGEVDAGNDASVDAGACGPTSVLTDAGCVSESMCDTMPSLCVVNLGLYFCESHVGTHSCRNQYASFPLPPSPPAVGRFTTTALTVTDTVTGLMWQRSLDPTTYTQAGGASACQALALAGSTDWRLPTRIEMLTILDFSSSNPVKLDGTVFLDSPNPEVLWSSSPAPGVSPTAGWNVDIGTASARTDEASVDYKVRCVR